MHHHGKGGFVRREEFREDGSYGAVGGGEVCSQVAGFRIGEDDAGVAVEESVDVVFFGDENGAAPVERAAGGVETCYMVHAGGSPRAFAESGVDAEAVEELEGLFGRFGFEAGTEAFEYRGSAAFFFHQLTPYLTNIYSGIMA